MGLMDLFKRKNSGEIARDRLKLLLVSDRANCSPEVMEKIKNDIIQVISKYMEIDAEGLDGDYNLFVVRYCADQFNSKNICNVVDIHHVSALYHIHTKAVERDKTAVSPEQMVKLIDELREDFDYILLDCPAGIEQGFKNAIAGADRALVPFFSALGFVGASPNHISDFYLDRIHYQSRNKSLFIAVCPRIGISFQGPQNYDISFGNNF